MQTVNIILFILICICNFIALWCTIKDLGREYKYGFVVKELTNITLWIYNELGPGFNWFAKILWMGFIGSGILINELSWQIGLSIAYVFALIRYYKMAVNDYKIYRRVFGENNN